MFVSFNAKTVQITSSISNSGDARAGHSSTSGVPRDTGPLGEHAEPRGAEDNTEICTEGVRFGAEVPGLTQTNPKPFKDKDPVAASLEFGVS